ncbi:MAG: serine/threonine protein kinase [Okeania sp. SIO2H7]|nr:serine/threonine protein kinase [Okeania sp. SIO2H7]
MALQKGDKLNKGKYTIVKELGDGRFGITYLATVNSSISKEKKRKFLGLFSLPKQEKLQNQKPEKVVIKTLNDKMYEQAKDGELEKRKNDLLTEAEALSNCKHPHIVKFKKHFCKDEKLYLVMEHIAGDNLATLLESLPGNIMPEPQALAYIKQIGEALITVHENELVHRDVKPDNIILRAGKEEAILIDFGLARRFEDIQTTVNPTINSKLDPITYAFFAPELYDPTAKRGAYTDVYSLAATLYFLLTGEVPPSAEKKKELVAPKEFNPKISDAVNKAIIQGMEFDWEKRPQTMAEWLALLPLPVVEKEPESPPPKKEPLKLQDIISLFLTLLGILATLLVGLYSQETREKIEKFFPSPSPSPTPKSIEGAKLIDRNTSNF